MVWPVWLQEGPTVKPPNHVSAASVAGGGRGRGAVSLQERARARASSTDASPVAGAEGLPCCSSQLRLALLCCSLVDDVDRLLDHRYHCVLSSRILTQRENYSRNPGFVDALEKKKTTGKSCGTFPHRNFHGNVFDFHTEIFGPRAPRCSIRVLWATERIKDLVFEEQPFSGGQCNCGRRAVSVRAVTSSIGTRSR